MSKRVIFNDRAGQVWMWDEGEGGDDDAVETIILVTKSERSTHFAKGRYLGHTFIYLNRENHPNEIRNFTEDSWLAGANTWEKVGHGWCKNFRRVF